MIRVSGVSDANAEVVWRVHDLMEEEQGLRTTTADIEIVGGDQSVTLLGRVRTEILYDLANRLARQGAGLWTVDNRLIDDERLAMQVSTRIATDPRTAETGLWIDVFFGVVRVTGSLHGQQEREAVLELAASVPGVVSVEDMTSIER